MYIAVSDSKLLLFLSLDNENFVPHFFTNYFQKQTLRLILMNVYTARIMVLANKQSISHNLNDMCHRNNTK